MITMRETKILEFKETITNTFLKTVSAFSNYNAGAQRIDLEEAIKLVCICE